MDTFLLWRCCWPSPLLPKIPHCLKCCPYHRAGILFIGSWHWFGRISLQLVLEVSYECIRGDSQGRCVMGQVLAILSLLFQQQEEMTKPTLLPSSLPMQWPTCIQTLPPPWKPVIFSSASLQTKKFYLQCPAFHKSQLVLSEHPQKLNALIFLPVSHKKALRNTFSKFPLLKDAIWDWGWLLLSQHSWKWCWVVVRAQVNGRKKMNRHEMEKIPHTWVKNPIFWAQEQKHRLVTEGSTAAFYWQSQCPKPLPSCRSFRISFFAAIHTRRWITTEELRIFFFYKNMLNSQKSSTSNKFSA